MRTKLIHSLLIVSLTVAVLAVVMGCAPEVPPEEEAPPEVEVPQLIKCTGWDIGAGGIQAIQVMMTNAIVEKYGIKVRNIPATSLMGRYIPLYRGDVDFHFADSSYVDAPEGVSDFAEMEWGPQDVQMCYGIGCKGEGPAVRGDSDIYTLADLRGKRVPYMVGSPSSIFCTLAYLNFAGLTWDDVVRVEVPSYTAAVKAMDEGRVDVVHLIAVLPEAIEIESHPWGLRWLQMPASDTEGWARIRAMKPMTFIPAKVTEGAGIDEAHPVEMFMPPLGVAWTCMKSTPEDIAYFWTKALDETYPVYYPKMSFIVVDRSIEVMLETWAVSTTPMHKGAIRYFKEIGVWTDELEARNNELLERKKTLKEIFDRAKNTAIEEGMSAADFPAFWLEQRRAAGYPVTSLD